MTLGYGEATRRYYSDTRVLLEKCGAIMRHFSDTREPTGDKVRKNYLLFLVAYVSLVTIINLFIVKPRSCSLIFHFSQKSEGWG